MPVKPEIAMRTRPKAARIGTANKPSLAPVINHKSKNCNSCSTKAATRLAKSHRPTAGTTRRSGSTIQSVSAKMKRPSGLPERADMGMRWYCM